MKISPRCLLVSVSAAVLAAIAACQPPGDFGPPGGFPGVASNATVATSFADTGQTQTTDEADTGKLDLGPSRDMPNITDGGDGCDQDVDIVFVMDVSTTMGPFIDQLATEIIFVDEALDTMELPGEPHYGLVVFVDDYALLNTGQPYDSVALLQQDFNQWSTFTASNQQVGGGNLNTTWPENSLDAMFAAAAPSSGGPRRRPCGS